MNRRTRVARDVALDERPNVLDFVLGDGRRAAVARDDRDNAVAPSHDGEDRRRDVDKAVTGKKWPVDPLLPVFPATPARARREKRLEAFALDLLDYRLFVSGPRPCGIPRHVVRAFFNCQGATPRPSRLPHGFCLSHTNHTCHKIFISSRDAVAKGNLRFPAHLAELGVVEQLPGRAVGFRMIENELAFEADHVAHRFR